MLGWNSLLYVFTTYILFGNTLNVFVHGSHNPLIQSPLLDDQLLSMNGYLNIDNYEDIPFNRMKPISEMTSLELVTFTDLVPKSAYYKTLDGLVREYNFTISYINSNPDNLFDRKIIAVNGQRNSPLIEANVGDILVINVFNQLDVPTSLHMHGLYFKGIPFFDGAYGINECGISPSGDMTYVVPVIQTGTYWYHSHYKGQYVDGFRGPIILKPSPKNLANLIDDDSIEHIDTLPVDEDFLITYEDWYHREYLDLYKTQFMNMYNPGGAEPVPDSCLVNFFNNGTLPVFNIQPNKVYRFRIINMSALSTFNFHIDNHDLEVVEMDGVLIEPIKIDTVHVAAAQRLSVIVKSKTEDELKELGFKKFTIHGQMDQDMFDYLPDNIVLDANSLLSYDYEINNGNENEVIEFDDEEIVSEFDDLKAIPIDKSKVENYDKSFTLNVWLSVLNDGFNHAQFNNITFKHPLVPTIFSMETLSNEYVNNTLSYGYQTNALIAEYDDIIQLVIQNFDGASHPFHMHGYEFQVLGRYEEYYKEGITELQYVNNPPRRDTVIVPAEGSVVIRFKANNPGAWLFHCHIQWHMDAGLTATIVSLPEKKGNNPAWDISPKIRKQCDILGTKMHGNAMGNEGLNLTGYEISPDLIPGYFTLKGIVAMIMCIISALIGSSSIIYYAIDARNGNVNHSF